MVHLCPFAHYEALNEAYQENNFTLQLPEFREEASRQAIQEDPLWSKEITPDLKLSRWMTFHEDVENQPTVKAALYSHSEQQLFRTVSSFNGGTSSTSGKSPPGHSRPQKAQQCRHTNHPWKRKGASGVAE